MARSSPSDAVSSCWPRRPASCANCSHSFSVRSVRTVRTVRIRNPLPCCPIPKKSSGMAKSDTPTKTKLTATEVARLFGYSARHWRRQAALGKVPGAHQLFGPRGHWVFDDDELRKLCRTRKREVAPWASLGKRVVNSGGAASSEKSSPSENRAAAQNSVAALKQQTSKRLSAVLERGKKNSTPPLGGKSPVAPTSKLKLVSSATT